MKKKRWSNIHCIWFVSQPEGLGVAFFATGPGLGLIMYILSTLEFPTHNLNFHLLTTSVNAKYYCTLYMDGSKDTVHG